MKNLDHPRNISLNLQQYTILFLLISKNIIVDLNKTKIVTICADSNKTNVFRAGTGLGSSSKARA